MNCIKMPFHNVKYLYILLEIYFFRKKMFNIYTVLVAVSLQFFIIVEK